MIRCLVVMQQRFVSMAARRYKLVTFVLLSDDRSGRQMIKNFSLRHRLHRLFELL